MLERGVNHCSGLVANVDVPPLGTLPNAEALSSSASSCCRSCIRLSPRPVVAVTPGKVWPNLVPPSHAISASSGCVAQKPCVRVAPLPVFFPRSG